jgi:hypothetical protein
MMKYFSTVGVAFVLGVTLADVSSALCAAPQLRDGAYVNVDPNTRTITRISLAFRCDSVARTVRGSDGIGTIVHDADPFFQVIVWGSCTPRDCDWGTTEARLHRHEWSSHDSYVAVYDHGFARRTVEIFPIGSEELRLVVSSTYNDGRPFRRWTDTFRWRPRPGPAGSRRR